LTIRPLCEQPTGVIEMQMAEHDHIDVAVAQAQPIERAEQDVLGFQNAVPLPQFRFEECPNPGFEENAPIPVLHQHRAARKLDATLLIGRTPPAPNGSGCIAEHRAAVEALVVSGHGLNTEHAARMSRP
jgi:hypothetical protein